MQMALRTEDDTEGVAAVAPFVCVVSGKAEPAGSKVPGVRKDGSRFVRDANPKAKAWKGVVAATALAKFGSRPLMEGPLSLWIAVWMPRPKYHYGTGKNAETLKPNAPFWHTTKPDTTKLVRGIEDALTGIVWKDDAQVVYQECSKQYGNGRPQVVIRVEPIEEVGHVQGQDSDGRDQADHAGLGGEDAGRAGNGRRGRDDVQLTLGAVVGTERGQA